MTTKSAKIKENNARILVLTKALINTVVRAEEHRCGHVFSGGRGLTMFLKVHTDAGLVRTSANGVLEDELSSALKVGVPGFLFVESILD